MDGAAIEKLLLLARKELGCFEGDSSLLLFPKRFSASGDGDDLFRLEFLDGEKRFRLGNSPPRNAEVSFDVDANFEERAGLINNARFEDATVA